jgi:hypothetical protein
MTNKNSNNSRVSLRHGRVLKVHEPYAAKVARTVLWGRKLPGAAILETVHNDTDEKKR